MLVRIARASGQPHPAGSAAIGAGAIVLLKNVISAYTQRWPLILGTFYIITMFGAPQGLWNLGRRRRASS